MAKAIELTELPFPTLLRVVQNSPFDSYHKYEIEYKFLHLFIFLEGKPNFVMSDCMRGWYEILGYSSPESFVTAINQAARTTKWLVSDWDTKTTTFLDGSTRKSVKNIYRYTWTEQFYEFARQRISQLLQSCEKSGDYSKSLIPISPKLELVQELEEHTSKEPESSWIATSLEDFISAFKLLSLCPSVDLDGISCIRVPKNFPLEPEVAEPFFLNMSEEGVLNNVGNGEEIVWQLNRTAYRAYATEHSINLTEVVATDYDEAKVRLEISRFEKNIDAIDNAITGSNGAVATLNDEEVALRARLEEIDSERTVVIHKLESEEIRRRELLEHKHGLDAQCDLILERRKKFVAARDLLAEMSVNDRNQLLVRFQK